ncbi:MAG: ABC transporter ATP-binding protein [Acholeplasmataceae bacterium]
MMYAGKQGRGKNDGSQKARNTKKTLKKLWSYLYFYKIKLLIALIFTIVSNLLSLVGPYLSGRIIQAMTDGVDFEKVFRFAILMVGFYLSSAIMTYVLSISMVRISQSVVYKMRKDVFAKLARVPVGYYDTNQTGDIISKMTYDIDTINTSLATDVMSIFTSIITVVISFVMMVIMSPILVLVFLVTIPLSVIVTRVLSRIVKKKYRIRNLKLGELNGFVEEMITGQRTIQSYVQEDSVLEKFDLINDEATKASYEAGYYSTTVGPTVNFISNLSVTLVGVFGGILYLYKQIDLGNFTSFSLYSRRFSGPINQMSNILAEIQSALAAAERVFDLLEEHNEVEDIEGAIDYEDVKGHIEFKNVDFSYVENTPVIRNLSFEAPPGKVVAIVGPTGAGKTTLINLLMRFYDVDQGEILADGKNIKELTRRSLRKAFSMVLQDTWLFHGSIHDNISYGNGEVSRLEVEEAAKKARIHSFILALPKGYDTILSDEGLNISKGQKQLLVIARAMLSKTKMLILDEATSNVDTHTEILIQKAMLALMENKTTFVIAHRLSTIQNADLILVVKDGNIVEKGNHTELLNQNGFYKALYQAQFE